MRRIVWRFGVTLALGSLLSTLSCGGGDSTGPSIDLDGSWHGSASTQAFNFFVDFTLTDDNGVIGGTATLSGSGPTCAADVSGDRSGRDLDLAITCQGYQPVVFEGTVSSAGNSVTGNIQGSGFPVTQFDMIRQ